jgi:hypothetical protein
MSEKAKKSPTQDPATRLYVAVIAADLLILLFFHVAQLISAVGLHRYYFWGGLLAVFIINCLIYGLLLRLTTAPARRFMLVVLWIVTFPLLMIIGFLGLFGIGIIIMGVIIIGGFALSWRYSPELRLTMILLFCTACYLAAFWLYHSWTVQAKHAIFVSVEQQQYLLMVAGSGFGDPAPLVLYQCNTLAFNCREVYRTEARYYWNALHDPQLLDLVINPATRTIDILFDDGVVDSYPLPEMD